MPKKLTQKRLKELFKYDPATGIFTRKIRVANCLKVGDVAGSLTNTGYLICNIDRDRYLMHRLAWLYMEGYMPENYIDHINRIKTDNRFTNLRHVTNQCNLRNSNIRKDNKSGVTGVIFYKRDKTWQSSIRIDSVEKFQGRFALKYDAVKARWEAEKKYNFPNCNTTSTAYLYLKERGLI